MTTLAPDRAVQAARPAAEAAEAGVARRVPEPAGGPDRKEGWLRSDSGTRAWLAVPGVPGDRGAGRRLGRGAVGHPVRHPPVRPVGRAEVRVPRLLRVRDQHAHPALLPE